MLTCAPSIRNITWTGPYVWNNLYRAGRITQPFKKECLMCEDLRFNYDYIKSSNKMVVVTEDLYFYRLHDESITGVYRKEKVHLQMAWQMLSFGPILRKMRKISVSLFKIICRRVLHIQHMARFGAFIYPGRKEHTVPSQKRPEE